MCGKLLNGIKGENINISAHVRVKGNESVSFGIYNGVNYHCDMIHSLISV